jgi:hypothetical protein
MGDKKVTIGRGENPRIETIYIKFDPMYEGNISLLGYPYEEVLKTRHIIKGAMAKGYQLDIVREMRDDFFPIGKEGLKALRLHGIIDK